MLPKDYKNSSVSIEVTLPAGVHPPFHGACAPAQLPEEPALWLPEQLRQEKEPCHHLPHTRVLTFCFPAGRAPHGLYNTGDVCDSHRIQQHKVFDGLVQRGKSSTGWFYGPKFHLVINDCGEILSFCLTPGNTDDRNKDVMGHPTKDIFGKLFVDKGYVSKKLSGELLEKGIELITKQKKNAKNPGIMHLSGRLLLRKRAVIESVNDFLKNIWQIEHSRHRSSCNFVVNLVAGLAA